MADALPPLVIAAMDDLLAVDVALLAATAGRQCAEYEIASLHMTWLRPQERSAALQDMSAVVMVLRDAAAAGTSSQRVQHLSKFGVDAGRTLRRIADDMARLGIGDPARRLAALRRVAAVEVAHTHAVEHARAGRSRATRAQPQATAPAV